MLDGIALAAEAGVRAALEVRTGRITPTVVSETTPGSRSQLASSVFGPRGRINPSRSTFTMSNRRKRTGPAARRVSTETKDSTKTTELYMYLAAVAAVVITALVVGDDGNGGADPVSAQDALRYITYLTIGYMIARGLAKAGSRDYYDDTNDSNDT
jgi:hypothetical protein